MTDKQFKEIRDRAWDWWCKNMLDWAVNTIKDFDNAPKWVKSGVDNSLEPDNLQKLLRLSQSRNFKVNYTKELLEFFEAERDGNEHEMIDALCDMVVVAINAGHTAHHLFSERLAEFDPMGYLVLYPLFELNNVFVAIKKRGYDPYKCLLETIKELESRTGAWNEAEGKWCKDVGAYTFEEADRIVSNYDTENERELYEDNTEFWRWQLHIKGEYCSFKVKKWYKADYEKCKVGGENA